MRINQTVLANLTAQAATVSYDFDLPDGADGVVVEIVSANPSSMSYTFTLAALAASSSGYSASTDETITSAAVSGAAVTRLAIHPTMPAATNKAVQAPMRPRARFTATRSTGSADLYVTATFFKA